MTWPESADGVTPGQVLRQLFDEAEARGPLPEAFDWSAYEFSDEAWPEPAHFIPPPDDDIEPLSWRCIGCVLGGAAALGVALGWLLARGSRR